MPPLGEVGTRAFLAHYWQKEPLLVRAALETPGALRREALFGLACDEAVESRLVLGSDTASDWACEFGPFEPGRLSSLPPDGWTLLVQAVDQWVPAVARVLERFDFLPRWRIDDVMVSCAAPGGGVGPHFDYYDVFLIQAAGRRRWRTGARCDALTPLRDHPQLKLLQTFQQRDVHDLGPGDMLYLPAGVSHWGTALDGDCVTYSVGFRAPSLRELVEHAGHLLGEALPEDARFRDGPIDARDAWCIDGNAVASLLELWRDIDAGAIESALVRAFGCEVTEPRYPHRIHALADAEDAGDSHPLLNELEWRGALSVEHNPASRFAYRPVPGGAELYVDGEMHETSLALARAVCAGRIEAERAGDTAGTDLIHMLIENGSLLLRAGRG